MYGSREDVLDAVAATGTILQALLERCSREGAGVRRAGEREWSVLEIVCHLRDAEEHAVQRLRAMRDEDSPLITAYDQDAWARDRRYAADDLRTAFARFLTFRDLYLAELARLSLEQWERPGRHETQGPMTIRTHALHMIAHDLVHTAQIGRQLAGVKK